MKKENAWLTTAANVANYFWQPWLVMLLWGNLGIEFGFQTISYWGAFFAVWLVRILVAVVKLSWKQVKV